MMFLAYNSLHNLGGQNDHAHIIMQGMFHIEHLSNIDEIIV